jgi:DNA-binding transcriptional MerR regulator
MKIGELAECTGLTRSKLRFYEAQGLISKVKRRANGYREYPPSTVQILGIIVAAQSGGFSLKEIRRLLPSSDMGRWNTEELLATLRHKVAEIEVLQQRLRRNRSHLLEVIRQVQHKVPGLPCAQNAEQVMKRLMPLVQRHAAGSRI